MVLMDPDDVRRVIDQAVADDRLKRSHHGKGKPGSVHAYTRYHGITRAEEKALAAYALYGNQERAAKALGIGKQTFKNHITSARKRLQAGHIFDLYIRAGWLIIPVHVEEPMTDD